MQILTFIIFHLYTSSLNYICDSLQIQGHDNKYCLILVSHKVVYNKMYIHKVMENTYSAQFL